MTDRIPWIPTIVFIGDSITDAGRTEQPDPSLGGGYVRAIADRLRDEGVAVTIVNAGISGDRVRDLRRRLANDCLVHAPDFVSILVGINDMWRRYDSDDATPVDAFESDYRWILETARAKPVRPVLIEPFLLPINEQQKMWREDLDPKIEVVRRLSREFEATLVPADELLAEAARDIGNHALAPDGIHPSGEGHRLLRDMWLSAVDVSGAHEMGGSTAGSDVPDRTRRWPHML